MLFQVEGEDPEEIVHETIIPDEIDEDKEEEEVEEEDSSCKFKMLMLISDFD